MSKQERPAKTPEQIVRESLKSPLACDLVKKIQAGVPITKPEKNGGKPSA